jgi:hydroxymethylpyrimidine/phosphomethylpyrimidine kinase
LNGRLPRLLIIAGSDSSGGSGIQADIKTATALGVYAMTAITAVTAQDTSGIRCIYPIPPSIVREQIDCCLQDIGADAIKIGMLGSAKIAETVADVLECQAQGKPLVLDPVLASTSGTSLLDPAGIEILKSRLFPLATLVTPNLPELELLVPARDPNMILDMGASAVLLKGGHGEGESVTDFLITREGTEAYKKPRLTTPSTHGTGCTLATAIACGLASGHSIHEAVAIARDFVQAAIESAPGFGRGRGPLDHMHSLQARSR